MGLEPPPSAVRARDRPLALAVSVGTRVVGTASAAARGTTAETSLAIVLRRFAAVLCAALPAGIALLMA
ncbi:hypothetical protein [Amycolatopsis nalaikhensis]|uniref:Uncharacterized protein n=1 Tax=Amycolatopsis nalaikhensis TaxID=715472 RepID=A0ABY8XEP6_9PSEU|nr:hypothetical protein [Amycolatopsis sp. 2-2]WIV54086.1 hypothetical protein QP939_35190 [Amycolatopsis sp. 2-2]